MASVVQAVSGVWRAHSVLDESDGPDSTPEAPDRFRSSSSSLRSLRVSLKARHPLRSMQAQSEASSSQEAVRQPSRSLRLLARSTRNSIGGAYQKLQKNCNFRDECLVASPCQTPEGEENVGFARGCAQVARTPHRSSVTPTRAARCTPQSAGRKTPRSRSRPAVAPKAGASRRQLVRMAALRSPFASPNTLSRHRQFDQDLASVSTGLNKLKCLSQAFDDLIRRDDRAQAIENYHGVMVRGYRVAHAHPALRNRQASICHKTKRMQETVKSWTDGALLKMHKAT